ncbi:hypothetical protein IT397_00930, partial [Candidatus Nomurabacteria bacterium]|nr:hypothetical protein [Candidatus Nomurabacteria bacterium]
MKIFKNGKKIFMTFAGVLSLAVLVFYHAGIILAAVPTITTGIAESITKTSATLNSTINDNGGELISSTGFEYGLTNSYGSQVTGIQSYEFVSYFGQTPGTAEGEFGSTVLSSDSLFLSANESTGVLYVTDIENNRIQVFDSDGNFIKTFGWGVSTGASQFEICTSGCQTGISGSGDGQF